MTPQATWFLERARTALSHARVTLGVDLYDDAGRHAYFAAFHAAQALIRQETGRVLKTHNGVRTQFSRLTKDMADFEPSLRAFLARAYNLKTHADYGLDSDAPTTDQEARRAIQTAELFVAKLETLIASLESGL